MRQSRSDAAVLVCNFRRTTDAQVLATRNAEVTLATGNGAQRAKRRDVNQSFADQRRLPVATSHCSIGPLDVETLNRSPLSDHCISVMSGP
jgi:hypothetical protein